MVLAEVRTPGREFRLNDKTYALLTDDQARQMGRRRAWDLSWLVDQQANPSLPFEIDLGGFNIGAGISFADAPGSYESAEAFDFAPGVAVTWPQLATCEDFPAGDGARRARIVFFDRYLYIARGCYIAKYQPDVTPNGTWAIKELHYLGSTSFSVTGGRIAAWGGSLYVPVVDTSSGTLQKFQRLTTQNVTVTEVQTVAISGTPTGGTYTLTFNDGFGSARTTAGIAYNANAATVEAALRLLPGLEKVTVVSSGSTPNFTHTITMTAAPSAAGASSPPQLTSSAAGLTGGAPVITHGTTTAGTGDRWDEGPASREAVAFAVQADSLVRAEGNVVSRALTDPMTAGNWGAEYAVGETGEIITDLAVYPGQDLIVGKTDGPWVFNASNVAEPAIPELGGLTDDFNCVGMDYAHGYVMIPHRVGLVRWRPGAWEVVGAEQDYLWEVDQAVGGWGRVTGIATYGRRSYLAVDERTGQLPYVHSLAPNGRRAGGLTPHIHQAPSTVGVLEGAAIATFAGQAMPAGVPGATISDDSAVGTIAWSNPGNSAAEDGSEATAAAGVSHYLKHLNLGLDGYVPSTATIVGIEARVKRRAVAASTATAATSPGTGANNNRGGTNAWSNPTNILSSNNSHATCASSGTTQHLEATNFGFAVPSTATILGITVEVERKASVLGGTATVATFTQAGDSSDGWTRDGGANPDAEIQTGDSGSLPVGNSGLSGNPDKYRAYLRFDTSSIPDNATITSARLRLYQSGGMFIGIEARWYDHGGTITYAADHYAADNGFATNYQSDNGTGTATAPSWCNLSTLSNINKSGNTGFRLHFDSAAFYYANIAGQQAGASVEPQLEVTYTEPGVKDHYVGLIKADGTLGSADKAATSTYWPTADAYASYGGAADLWSNAWAPADVNDADFGVSLRATIEDTGITASVDHIRVTVTYSDGDVVDSVVRLVVGGVVSGTNKADTTTQWPSSLTWKSYGGAADLWGLTPSAAQVRASDFGIVVSADTGGGSAAIDRVEVKVYFQAASDPAAILVTALIADSQVVGSCYHLGTGTLIPALDPYIDRHTRNSVLRSSRYFAPSRRVRKTYVEVEGVIEIEGNTVPTNNYVKLEAAVDGAAAFELLATPGGSALRAKSSGPVRGFFPLGAGSVGRDVQVIATVVGLGDATGIAVKLRDFCIRGVYDPRAVEGGTVSVLLEPGGRNEAGGQDTRSREQVHTDLKTLVGGDGQMTTQLAAIVDPEGRSGYVKVHGVQFQEVLFKGDQRPTLVATIELRKVAYA